MAASIPVSRTCLLLVDLQKGFDEDEQPGADFSSPNAHENVTKLLTAFRGIGTHVIHVQHQAKEGGHSLNPEFSPTGFEIADYCKPLPSEAVFVKTVNSAFIGTGLELELRRRDIGRLIIAGKVTDECVSTTVRMAANLGVLGKPGREGIYLVGDASRAWPKGEFSAELVHQVNLASLHNDFCTVTDTETVIAEAKGWSTA